MYHASSSAMTAEDKAESVPTSVANVLSTKTFEALPEEIVLKIGETLSLKDKAHLGSMSLFHYQIFKPELDAAKLLELLNFVVRGEQDAAHAMLAQYPELLLKAGNVTDYSGRTFKKITAYEYAYWAKDTHMCRMLEAHMDDATKAKILERCEAMERDGLTYEQHGVVVENSKHFDFTPLITALTRYIQRFDNARTTDNWEPIGAAWMEVGLAQRDMPVHVVNEYFYPRRSFNPLPAFNEMTLPRNITFFNYITGSTTPDAWYPLVLTDSSGLGVSISIIRSKGWTALQYMNRGVPISPPLVADDLAAVSHLDKVRTDDLIQSRANLLPIVPEQRHGMLP